jgi:hypothetical protein
MHQRLFRSYSELGNYFKELIEYKIGQMDRGEKEDGTMDLLSMPPT